VLHEDNLRLLQERSLIVCLMADVNAILRRAGSGNQRPLLMTNDKVQRIEELLKERKRYYASAHIEIDTSDLTVDEVVGKILALAASAHY
jgi:shikimate kinase